MLDERKAWPRVSPFVLVPTCVITVLGGPANGLRAELNIENADSGIPGVTKMYETRLINRSRWPIRFHYCDFVDDAMAHGEELAYTVERWDGVAHDGLRLFERMDWISADRILSEWHRQS